MKWPCLWKVHAEGQNSRKEEVWGLKGSSWPAFFLECKSWSSWEEKQLSSSSNQCLFYRPHPAVLQSSHQALCSGLTSDIVFRAQSLCFSGTNPYVAHSWGHKLIWSDRNRNKISSIKGKCPNPCTPIDFWFGFGVMLSSAQELFLALRRSPWLCFRTICGSGVELGWAIWKTSALTTILWLRENL